MPEFYDDFQKVAQWRAFLRKNKLQAPEFPVRIQTLHITE